MNYKAGQQFVIDFIKEDCILKNYLTACGFIEGAKVLLLAVSPLKKTLLLSIADSVISLKTAVLTGIVWKK